MSVKDCVQTYFNMDKQLKFTTYNSHGHGAGRFEYIQKLCDNSDFILIQEHWLLNKQSHLFEQKFPGIRAHSVSGMDDNTILRGRPFGGCAVLWKECLKFKVTPVITDCKRLC